MFEENYWQNNPDSGITSDPEGALQRETEKSKALKVERLQLRNKIESLRSENLRLREENQQLKEKTHLSLGSYANSARAKPKIKTTSTPLLLASMRNGLLFLFFIIFFIFYYFF